MACATLNTLSGAAPFKMHDAEQFSKMFSWKVEHLCFIPHAVHLDGVWLHYMSDLATDPDSLMGFQKSVGKKNTVFNTVLTDVCH